MTGQNAVITWAPPKNGAIPEQYMLEAGSVPGATNLGSYPTPASQPGFFAPGAPNGTVLPSGTGALTSGGDSAASNEVAAVVKGNCTAPPPAPTDVRATVAVGRSRFSGACQPRRTVLPYSRLMLAVARAFRICWCNPSITSSDRSPAAGRPGPITSACGVTTRAGRVFRRMRLCWCCRHGDTEGRRTETRKHGTTIATKGTKTQKDI